MVHRLVQLISVFAITVSLVGCGIFSTPDPEIRYVTRTVEVNVPIPYVPDVPPELQVDYNPHIPEFITPSNASAVVALDRENNARLKQLVIGLKSRLDAWKAWHTEISTPQQH